MQERKKKLNDLFKKVNINILIAVIFSLVFFSVIYIRNGIMYITNDDIAMRSISSGVYLGGEKSFQMIFATFPFNILVTFLYRITNKFDWYGVILICSTIFYLTYTIFYIIKQKKEIVEKIFYTCVAFFIVSILFSTFLVNITFTVVSTFIAICCLVLYILPYGKLKNLIMSIGIILSFGIRAKACLMVLVFFVPIFLYKNIGDMESLKKDFILGVKIGILLLICIIVQKVMVSNSQWKEYLAYNEKRSLFYDYYYDTIINLPEEEKKEIFYNAGFNEQEMEIMCSKGAIGFLENIPYRMSTLIDECREHGIKQNSNFKKLYIDLIKNTKLAKYYFITLLILVIYLIKSKNIKDKILQFLILLVFQLLILTYLVYQGRLLDRVVIPLFASYIIMNIAIWLNEENIKKIIRKILNYNRVLFIVIGIILYIISIQNIQVDKARRELTDRTNEILEYFAKYPDNFYIYDRNSLENFKFINKYRACNYLNMSGWTTFSPLHNAKINKYGSDTLKELLYKEKVFLVIPYSLNDDNDKYNFLFENTTIELVDKVEENYIYKLKNE